MTAYVDREQLADASCAICQTRTPLGLILGYERSMRILCVNCVISEFGGVEIAALNLARGLADRGHDVHFLAAKDQRSPVAPPDLSAEWPKKKGFESIHCHYRSFPRIYPMGQGGQGHLRKAIWHAQDLLHPANETIFNGMLREIRPDVIILHNVTAVGLNIWRSIRKTGIPCIQVIHDLSLICFNFARFRGGRPCERLCAPCRLQKKIRFSLIRSAPHFAFVSPSHATLNEIERYEDLSKWRREVISNPNTFLVKPRKALPIGEKPHFLYVGRLDPSKGIEMLLKAASRARDTADFDLDILGPGTLETALRQKYASAEWIRFHGSVDQDTVAEFMSRATALLVPSLWLETVPGVAVHALYAGLPVLGSRIGGIPEHVADGENGRLLPPGDEAAWGEAIAWVARHPEQIDIWSAACLQSAKSFDPEIAINAYETLIKKMTAARDNSH